MFNDLTVDELAGLSTMLCDAIYEVRHYADHWRYDTHGLSCDLRVIEHEVWHTRCSKSGIRCLQDGLAS